MPQSEGGFLPRQYMLHYDMCSQTYSKKLDLTGEYRCLLQWIKSQFYILSRQDVKELTSELLTPQHFHPLHCLQQNLNGDQRIPGHRS